MPTKDARCALSDGELRDWLLDTGFANVVGGQLRPTPLGVEVAEAITPRTSP